MGYRLINKKSNNSQLVRFTDSDYASDIEDRKSTSGYIFTYGDCVISWNSSKQKTVSLSSTEAEYIGLAQAAKEGIWLYTILEELGRAVDVVQILCDNKSTISLAHNPEFHARSKHIDIRHHFIRNLIQDGYVKIDHLGTNELPADLMTKGLPRIKHYKCVDQLNMKN